MDAIRAISNTVDIYNKGLRMSGGTLGLIVKRANQFYGLTARHVLITHDSNEPDSISLDKYHGFFGDDLSNETFGLVHSPIRNGNQIGIVQKREDNFLVSDLDMGIFLLTKEGVFDGAKPNQIAFFKKEVKRILHYSEIKAGMKVKKFGAKTEDTYGIIRQINRNIITIGKDENNPLMRHKYRLSKAGDSGSVWILNNDEDFLTCVGMHINGDGEHAFANPIIYAFKNLKLELI